MATNFNIRMTKFTQKESWDHIEYKSYNFHLPKMNMCKDILQNNKNYRYGHICTSGTRPAMDIYVHLAPRGLKSVCHFKNRKYQNFISDWYWCVQYDKMGKTISNDLI